MGPQVHLSQSPLGSLITSLVSKPSLSISGGHDRSELMEKLRQETLGSPPNCRECRHRLRGPATARHCPEAAPSASGHQKCLGLCQKCRFRHHPRAAGPEPALQQGEPRTHGILGGLLGLTHPTLHSSVRWVSYIQFAKTLRYRMTC